MADGLQTGLAPWHYTNINRSSAERLLTEGQQDGVFLVRDSESVAGASVLSVGFERRVHHYRLLSDASGVRMEGEATIHPNLIALVEHCKYELTLVCKLTHPIVLSASGDGDGDDDDDDDDEDKPEAKCRTRDALKRMQAYLDEGRRDQLHKTLVTYIEEGACEDSEFAKAGTGAGNLHEVITQLSAQLGQELAFFSSRVQRIRDLYVKAHKGESEHAPPPSALMPPGPGEQTFDALMARLQYTKDLLQDTDFQATEYYKTVSCEHTPSSFSSGFGSAVEHTNTRVFDVKRADAKVGSNVTKSSKTCLTVNATEGTVAVGRGLGASDDDKLYKHSQVVQLVKSRSDKRRLGITFEGKKRKDFVFQDAITREEFCQAVQLIKNRFGDAAAEHLQTVSVFIGTFNMGEATPPSDLSDWFESRGDGITLPEVKKHDLYAIGTQEGAMSDKDWAAMIKKHIGPGYSQIALVSLWQIRLVVFLREGLLNKVTHVQTSHVATGIANALGNKGAVGMSCFIAGTSFCFINCHLTAGAKKWARRNQNYFDILSKLQLGQKRLSIFDATNQFHHCIWFGDMNYRVNLPIRTILDILPQRNFRPLLKADQMIRQRNNGNSFFAFEEGQITFAPTYRYERGTRATYKWEKQKATHVKINVPSWCDRVLWKSFPHAPIKQTSYGCPKSIMTSDHSPVFATFDVAIANQYVSTTLKSDSHHLCRVEFTAATAKIHTSSKTNFYVEFYATFLEGSLRTRPNSRFDKTSAFNRGTLPVWESDDFPGLAPIIPNRDYLENEHILVAVRSQDGDESYGEGSISLSLAFSPNPVPFTCILTHKGEHAGELFGFLHVINAVGESKTSEVSIDEDARRASAVAGNPSLDSARTAVTKRRSIAVSDRRTPSGAPISLSRTQAGDRSLSEPPPRPPKKAALKPIEDDVGSWLASIGAGHLADVFIQQGYDHPDFFGDLDQKDLWNMGITDRDLTARILQKAAGFSKA